MNVRDKTRYDTYFYVYHDAANLSCSYSHNMTKINIQNL